MSSPTETTPGVQAASSFSSVRSARLPERVASQVRQAIFAGEYAPGQRLPTERDLMRQFETSRSTVREALRILEQAGLLHVRPGSGGGAYVAEPTYELLSASLRQLIQLNQFSTADLRQARLLLEPGIAWAAARAARPQDLDALRECLEQARELVDSAQDASAASRRFHFLIAQATGNKLLVMLDRSLLELAGAYDVVGAWTKKAAAAVLAEHRALLEAIRTGDADRAHQLMRDHLSELVT